MQSIYTWLTEIWKNQPKVSFKDVRNDSLGAWHRFFTDPFLYWTDAYHSSKR